MTTIDLTRPAPPASGVLDALPRRVALTLVELQLVAELAGGAPLPFDVVVPEDGGEARGLEGRLGATRGSADADAYRRAASSLHDPAVTLARRGLLDGDARTGTLDEGLAGAVGLLATPTVALDLDLAVDGLRAKAWHRQSGDAVASLATTDGLVFELAWYPTSAWPGELARVAVLPEDAAVRASQVPARLDLPYTLVDAATEAAGSGRHDLLQLLVAQHLTDAPGTVLGPDDQPLTDAELPGVLTALGQEAHGRLRALVGDVGHGRADVVGVRSWVLLADGWRTLHPHDDGTRVELRSITAADLSADLAPVLAEVVA